MRSGPNRSDYVFVPFIRKGYGPEIVSSLWLNPNDRAFGEGDQLSFAGNVNHNRRSVTRPRPFPLPHLGAGGRIERKDLSAMNVATGLDYYIAAGRKR